MTSDDNPFAGKRLRRRYRNFTVDVSGYVSSLAGPPAHMRRLRDVESALDDHLARLADAYELHRGDPAGWRAAANAWNFDRVNQLIATHNRWYPAEARLAMDPRTRDFVGVGGRSYVREPLDAAWILSRFPADAL
ncbi:MAG TPA: hypothetical protein VGH52_07715 [Gaiellaceae bacterium]